MTEQKVGCWAYVGSDGRFCADSDFKTEDDAWRIMLGWPTHGEVRQAKADGDKVVWVEVTV